MSSREGTAAQQVPETYSEKLNCEASGQRPQLFLCWQVPRSESALPWWTQLVLLWSLPEIPLHPTHTWPLALTAAVLHGPSCPAVQAFFKNIPRSACPREAAADLSAPGWAWVATVLRSQHGLPHVSLSIAQAAANSYYFVAPTRWPNAEHRQWLNLACTVAPPKWPKTNMPGGQPQTTTEHYPISSTNGKNHTSWGQPCCGYDWSSQQVSLRVNPTHWGANSNQGSTMTGGHTRSMQGTLLGNLAQVIRKTAPLGSSWYLLYKATLQKAGRYSRSIQYIETNTE